jgi:hypothetical protein
LGEVDPLGAAAGVGVAEEEHRERVELVGEEELVEEVAAAGVDGEGVERRVAVDVEVLADPADEGAVVQLVGRPQFGEVGGVEAAAVDVDGLVGMVEIQAEVFADVPTYAGVEAKLVGLARVREVDLIAGGELAADEDVGMGGELAVENRAVGVEELSGVALIAREDVGANE